MYVMNLGLYDFMQKKIILPINLLSIDKDYDCGHRADICDIS